MTDTFPCMPDFQEGTGVCRRCGAIAAPCPSAAQTAGLAADRDEAINSGFFHDGVDEALTLLCKFLDVDPKSINWDAATETVEGDVMDTIGNIFRAKFGEEWSPTELGWANFQNARELAKHGYTLRGVRGLEQTRDMLASAVAETEQKRIPGFRSQQLEPDLSALSEGMRSTLTRDAIADIIREKVDYFLHDEQGPLDAADAILAALSSTDQSKLATSQDTGQVDT